MMTMAAPPDPVVQARTTEIEAFLANHANRLIGALTMITGSRAAAEDALQDALVKAWDRRDQPIEQLTAWLTVVATNNARSGWRRRQAEQRALDKVGGRATLNAPAPEARDEALDRALRLLPERERQVALMHYVLDQPVAAIANALGVADGTVKTLLSRARRHLATHLQLADDAEGGAA
jgi:RNA polymerase sigma-70 factor, ECF subfamily